MLRLAALICNSVFDIALHDAFSKLGVLSIKPMDRSSRLWISPNSWSRVMLLFLSRTPSCRLPRTASSATTAGVASGRRADLLKADELTGSEPDDGHPVILTDWIVRDGLKCLKIKLRGNDAAWDYERLVKVGQLAIAGGVEWLSADFNCTVEVPAYVNEMLDRLRDEFPRIYRMILYVEQPFPYELEAIALMFAPWRRASRCSWTRARTTGD